MPLLVACILCTVIGQSVDKTRARDLQQSLSAVSPSVACASDGSKALLDDNALSVPGSPACAALAPLALFGHTGVSILVDLKSK